MARKKSIFDRFARKPKENKPVYTYAVGNAQVEVIGDTQQDVKRVLQKVSGTRGVTQVKGKIKTQKMRMSDKDYR